MYIFMTFRIAETGSVPIKRHQGYTAASIQGAAEFFLTRFSVFLTVSLRMLTSVGNRFSNEPIFGKKINLNLPGVVELNF